MKTAHWMPAALMLLVLTSLASPGLAQDGARELYQEARELLNARDYAKAADGFASSTIVLAPATIPIDLVGLELQFAHVLFDASLLPVSASNAVPVTIRP